MRIPNCRPCAVPWFLWTHADPCRNPTCGKDELTLSLLSFFPRTRFSSDCLLEPEFPGETVCSNVASMCFMFSVCGELCLVLQNVGGLRKYRDAWEQNDMEWLKLFGPFHRRSLSRQTDGGSTDQTIFCDFSIFTILSYDFGKILITEAHKFSCRNLLQCTGSQCNMLDGGWWPAWTVGVKWHKLFAFMSQVANVDQTWRFQRLLKSGCKVKVSTRPCLTMWLICKRQSYF